MQHRFISACLVAATLTEAVTTRERVKRMVAEQFDQQVLGKTPEQRNIEPQSIKVIGAGFGRTGTDSLRREALNALNYKTYHMEECMKGFHGAEIKAFMDGDRADGAPLANILAREGYNASLDWPMSVFYEQLMAFNESAKLLGIDFDESGDANEASAIAAYDAWIAKVRATVPADRLLVFNVKQGWAPLCEFLGVADCPEEFPHSNAGANLIHEFKMAGYIADAFFPTVALLARCRWRTASSAKKIAHGLIVLVDGAPSDGAPSDIAV
ncbi:hypothetical protein JL721_6442 [Aureococcus anophagefferens]|nr:hypothetical protein JL721_6442 [Aureococcus anophagefferens]